MELPQPGVAMETSPPRFCMLSWQTLAEKPAAAVPLDLAA